MKAIILCVSGALLLTLVITGFVGAGSAPSADQKAIEQACLLAVVATQTAPVRVGTSNVVATAQSLESNDTSPVSDTERQAMKDHVAQALAKYYTGDVLTKKVKNMHDAIDHYTKTDVRYFGGGVDWMNFNTVTVNGSAASVSARVQIWAKKAQDQGNGKLVYAAPHSQMDYTFTLAKVNNGWLITDETWAFAPGWEP